VRSAAFVACASESAKDFLRRQNGNTRPPHLGPSLCHAAYGLNRPRR
jgi:hypothetical protein